MEWTRVSIGEKKGDVPQIPTLPESSGLDTDALSSHQRFMSSIGHMTEVIDNHEKSTKRVLLPGVEALGGFDSIRSFQDGVSAIGAESIGNGLEILLSKSIMGEVLLQKMAVESGQAIRLVVPEKFGGNVESFMLPIGATVDEAFWDGNRLKITFNY